MANQRVCFGRENLKLDPALRFDLLDLRDEAEMT
jgi:hypothetical protein